MNSVLGIVGNHPSGISFNELAKEAQKQNIVSRATLQKWIEDFEQLKVIETSGGIRRGQRKVIKTSDEFQKWLALKEQYEFEVGGVMKKILNLKNRSHSSKLTPNDFYEIYQLQMQLMRIPFDNYIAGRKYSEEVAKLLRDSAGKVIEPLYIQLNKIIEEQVEEHDLNYQDIYTNLTVLVSTAPLLALRKNDKSSTKNIEFLKKTVYSAIQKLENAI